MQFAIYAMHTGKRYAKHLLHVCLQTSMSVYCAANGDTRVCLVSIQHAIDQARDDVLDYSGMSETDVTWVMVITWSEMIPRMYHDPRIESVSSHGA